MEKGHTALWKLWAPGWAELKILVDNAISQVVITFGPAHDLVRGGQGDRLLRRGVVATHHYQITIVVHFVLDLVDMLVLLLLALLLLLLLVVVVL